MYDGKEAVMGICVKLADGERGCDGFVQGKMKSMRAARSIR
jgi:hypothetical protein